MRVKGERHWNQALKAGDRLDLREGAAKDQAAKRALDLVENEIGGVQVLARRDPLDELGVDRLGPLPV